MTVPSTMLKDIQKRKIIGLGRRIEMVNLFLSTLGSKYLSILECVLGFSREAEPIQYIELYERRDTLWEFTLWKARKAGVVIQSKSKGLRIIGQSQSESESLRTRNASVKGQEKIDVSAQAERANLFFLCLFVPLVPSSSELVDAHPHWGGPSALLSSPIQTLISARNSLTNPEIMFCQLFGHLLAQSS